MKKRILCLLMAVVMLFSLMVGCSKDDESSDKNEKKIEKKESKKTDEKKTVAKKVAASPVDMEVLAELDELNEEAREKGEKGRYLASEEPLELTVHMMNYDPEAWGRNGVYGEAEKFTNIHVKGTIPLSAADSAQEFTKLLLKETKPDIIYGSRTQINNAGAREKILVDLTPYVTDKTVMPNLAEIYEKNPDWLISVQASDGAIYICPKMRQPGPTQGWFTRADWMEKLGLENPKTLEEFEHVMERMYNGDPNGNGVQDEVPWIGDYKALFYFFGLNGGKYWEIENNRADAKLGTKMFMPYVTENYKQALIKIAEWYKKGYIDQQVFDRKNPRGELWGTDKGGMTFNWFSSTMSYNEQIKNVEGFHVAVMDPPANIYGESYCHSPGNVIDNTGWAISKDNQHLTETLRYFDFWYSTEGSLLNAMGIEGRDFTYDADHKPHYTDLAKNYEGGAPAYVQDIGCIGIGYYMKQEYLLDGMTPEAAAGQEHYNKDIITSALVPPYTFLDEEQEIIDNQWLACQTKIDEYMQKAVTGQVDVNATWDAYVKGLYDLGLADVEKVHNRAYARYLKKVEEASK